MSSSKNIKRQQQQQWRPAQQLPLLLEIMKRMETRFSQNLLENYEHNMLY
jgi:hypothetical protein